MQKILGPFRLYHRDGRQWTANRVSHFIGLRSDIFDSFDPAKLREHPFPPKPYPDDWEGFRFDKLNHNQIPGQPWLRYSHLESFLIRDSSGLIVPIWYVIEQIQQDGFYKTKYGYWGSRSEKNWYGESRRIGDWADYRGRSVRGVRKYKASHHMWRNPRTTQEIRERERTFEELREHDIHVRSRYRRYIPTAYEDLYPNARRNRNWKQFRRKQYR